MYIIHTETAQQLFRPHKWRKDNYRFRSATWN